MGIGWGGGGCGLEFREDRGRGIRELRLWWGRLGGVPAELSQEVFGEAGGLPCRIVVKAGAGRDGAEVRVGDNLFDDRRGGGRDRRPGLGEVGAGDLQAIEQETGAAWVEGVVGEPVEDLPDGGLDGGAIFKQRQIEGAPAAARPGDGDGAAGGVVVEAELFVAEADGAAAVAVGKDVAALEAGGFRCGVCGHGRSSLSGPPPGLMLRKVFEAEQLGLDFTTANGRAIPGCRDVCGESS